MTNFIGDNFKPFYESKFVMRGERPSGPRSPEAPVSRAKPAPKETYRVNDVKKKVDDTRDVLTKYKAIVDKITNPKEKKAKLAWYNEMSKKVEGISKLMKNLGEKHKFMRTRLIRQLDNITKKARQHLPELEHGRGAGVERYGEISKNKVSKALEKV